MSARTLRAVLFAGLACTIALTSWLILPGSPLRFFAAVLIALAVPSAWLAWSRPALPLALYAAVIPFNDLVLVGAGTTSVAKYLGVLAALALLLGLARSRAPLRPRPSMIAWWLLTALSVLSAAWALDDTRWAVLTPTFAQLVAIYTVAALYPFTVSDVRWLLGAMILGASVAGAYATYLYANAMYLYEDRLYIRTAETAADPNQFAAALLVPLAATILIAVASRSIRLKIALALALSAILGGIVVSGSRGALLATIAAAVYLAVRLRARPEVLAAAAIAILVTLPVWSFIANRAAIALSSGGAGRTDIWRVGAEAFRNHWLVGAGLGAFPSAFDAARLHVSVTHSLEWHRASHNLILSYAVELGAVGALLVLWAWWRTFRDAASIPPDRDLFAMRIGVEAGILALFVASLFLDIMFRKYTWIAFVAIAAVRAAAEPRERPAPAASRAVAMPPSAGHRPIAPSMLSAGAHDTP